MTPNRIISNQSGQNSLSQDFNKGTMEAIMDIIKECRSKWNILKAHLSSTHRVPRKVGVSIKDNIDVEVKVKNVHNKRRTTT